MFTSFDCSASQSSDQSLLTKTPTVGRPLKRKRVQVARACHWCRLHRVKCDSKFPCGNCQIKGAQCTNEGKTEARTLAQAILEIEKLRLQVKDLEGKLEEQDRNRSFALGDSPVQHLSSVSPPCNEISDANPHGSHKSCWEGIHVRSARNHEIQWFGPSSDLYFISRMSSYLRSVIPSTISDDQIHPNSASRCFASPVYSQKVILEDNKWTTDASAREEYLTGLQEEYFLGKFWDSYHCTYQILDETGFKDHYKSLWTSGAHSRRPSALVDMVLAICMQYGLAVLPRKTPIKEDKTCVDANDATIAGRWYYHRCQTLLAAEMESPSISTLQCHILSVVYLCNASFRNMAHTSLATAIRTANILGIHLEPSEAMPQAERELRKRIWWTLCAIEIKTCMKLGRPTSLQLQHSMCTFPADDHEAARTSGSNFIPVNQDVTWLTYGVQIVKLILAAQEVYESFYNKCDELVSLKDVNNIYTDGDLMESAANILQSNIKRMHEWRDQLPDALKTKRKDEGVTFSTDESLLDVEQFSPLWLQRQRIFLELLYHNLLMNLYRPFIVFPTTNLNTTPTTEQHSISCVSHAISITVIMKQMLKETEIVHGWHEAFQWQWNATVSIIGFVFAYPNHEINSSARKSLDDAIAVLELLGNHFAIAASAAAVACGLTAKAYTLMMASTPTSQTIDQDEPGIGSGDQGCTVIQDSEVPVMADDFAGSMGFAFESSLEWLTSDTSNLSDTWTLMQD